MILYYYIIVYVYIINVLLLKPDICLAINYRHSFTLNNYAFATSYHACTVHFMHLQSNSLCSLYQFMTLVFHTGVTQGVRTILIAVVL